jgi:hypothetical protein
VRKLSGVWFHSHEEDHEDVLVYRGRSYNFPRARAPRQSLEFKSDGTLVIGAPGPDDKATTTRGSWKVTENTLVLSTAGITKVYEIRTIEEDVLFLRLLR